MCHNGWPWGADTCPSAFILLQLLRIPHCILILTLVVWVSYLSKYLVFILNPDLNSQFSHILTHSHNHTYFHTHACIHTKTSTSTFILLQLLRIPHCILILILILITIILLLSRLTLVQLHSSSYNFTLPISILILTLLIYDLKYSYKCFSYLTVHIPTRSQIHTHAFNHTHTCLPAFILYLTKLMVVTDTHFLSILYSWQYLKTSGQTMDNKSLTAWPS